MEKNITPFLRQVARRYYSEGLTDGRCFVFPNRRSLVFFRKWLAEEVRLRGAEPLVMPRMMTEDDFFRGLGGMRVADRITLLIRLYDCYKALNPKAETLDDFIFWGDVLLGDFNDVDKYLVDPHRLFANVSDLKSIRDSFSYLTEKQREAMEKFIAHFDRIAGGDGDTSVKRDVKRDFLQIWNILEPLYNSFNANLREDGLAYEGMVYRAAAGRMRSESASDVLEEAFGKDVSTFVFVGLNALNECEKAVMRRMRDAGLAQFCWDYSGDMITDRQNKSSFFMKDNVREFPQAFPMEEVGHHVPNVTVVSVPSSVGQVKVIPEIIRGREDCAVVLPDENMLIPLLNTIPPEIGEINVTMGRNLGSSVFHSLMCSVADLQFHMRQRGGQWNFYHRSVREIFSNGIFVRAVGQAGVERIAQIVKDAKIYVPESDFRGVELMETVFRAVISDPKSTAPEQIREFAVYLADVVNAVVDALGHGDSRPDGMTLGFAKTWYCEVNRLSDKQLAVMPVTWVKILERILAPVSVPFRGEPLRGLQIMGPLETRALDFTNLVILSANEGTFPGRNVASSFIPPELRRCFGLPTYEFQDAVWAYYFYRMIARAENVIMLCDTRAGGLHSGEESRYIKQLEMHFGVHVKRSAVSMSFARQGVADVIPKTEEDVAKIRDVWFSASTLKNYLSCPAKFYYGKVRELKTEEEISESLDARTVGNVYHALMQSLYTGEEAMSPLHRFDDHKKNSGEVTPWTVTAEYLKSWLGRTDGIRAKVRQLVCDELGTTEIAGRDLVTADVIVRYARKTIERDLEYLAERKTDRFIIHGLELKEKVRFHDFTLFGYIDRLDSVVPGSLRVCDYKTGRVGDKDVNINDDNAQEIAAEVFDRGDNAKRPDIALQVFFYDLLLKEGGRKETIANTIYQTSALFNAPVAELPMNGTFYRAMEDGLKDLLDEIADVGVPFRRTEDSSTCENCDFKIICGK